MKRSNMIPALILLLNDNVISYEDLADFSMETKEILTQFLKYDRY